MTTPMIKLKDYRLRSSGNAKGQLIQLPVSVIREWSLKEGDYVELFKTVDGEIVIRPKKEKRGVL